jgi:hypothetical protein
MRREQALVTARRRDRTMRREQALVTARRRDWTMRREQALVTAWGWNRTVCRKQALITTGRRNRAVREEDAAVEAIGRGAYRKRQNKYSANCSTKKNCGSYLCHFTHFLNLKLLPSTPSEMH